MLDPLLKAYFSYIPTYPKGVTAGIYSDPMGLQRVLKIGMYSPKEVCSMLGEGYYFSNDLIELLQSKKVP